VTGARILCVSQDPQELRRILGGSRLEVVQWPESGAYGSDAWAQIDAACSGVRDLASLDCVVGENATSAPILFELRRRGYRGPLALVPHINPYPLSTFLLVLLAAQVWGPRDVVIAGSNASADLYGQFFGMKACAIPTYGIDTTLFERKDPAASRQRLGLPGGRLIVYTGRLARDKNVGGLLAACQSLRRAFDSVRLVLCVRFVDESYLEALRPLLGDAIVMRNVDQTEMPYVYSAADLFASCATSYYETFGRSPLESIACGTPVVVPAWDGFREHVHSAGGVLVPVDFFDEPLAEEHSYGIVDLAAFVKACEAVLRDPFPAVPTLDPDISSTAAACRIRDAIDGLLGESSGGTAQTELVATTHELVPRLAEALRIESSDDLLRLATCHPSELPCFEEALLKELYFALFANGKRPCPSVIGPSLA